MFTKSAKALIVGLALAVLGSTSQGASLAAPDLLSAEGAIYESAADVKAKPQAKQFKPWGPPCGPMIGPKCLKGQSLQCFSHNNHGCCAAARCVRN